MKVILPVVLLVFIFSCNSSHEPHRSKQEALYNYSIAERLDSLGIALGTFSRPSAPIEPVVRSGKLLFFSGKVSIDGEGNAIKGKLGESLTSEEGYLAARQVALRQLEVLKAEIGDLNKVVRIVKVLGMVNSAADFTEQHKVMNGFTDTMISIFGDRGKHARSAVGMASLPMGYAVEVEMIVEVLN